MRLKRSKNAVRIYTDLILHKYAQGVCLCACNTHFFYVFFHSLAYIIVLIVNKQYQFSTIVYPYISLQPRPTDGLTTAIWGLHVLSNATVLC